jgi:anaerobic ribonucleoside-triphosphate reductase activating protein
MKVRLAGIVNESVCDGPGLRIALFFQGCAHHCPGCHNPQTWNFDGGDEYDVDNLLAELPDTPLIKGVTLSGGDPFYQFEPALQIARAFHARGKDVWSYTGFTWPELLADTQHSFMDLVNASDVVVDGPFIQAQAQPNLPFYGSANQRSIDVQASLRSGEVILWKSVFK